MRSLGLLIAIVLSGCYTGVFVNRRVRPYPSKSISCPLIFDYYDEQSAPKLEADYVWIGTLELAWQPEKFEWTEKTQAKLHPAACDLGGDVVTYAGFTMYDRDPLVNATSGRRWGQFRVFRKKAAFTNIP
jgi:hypothetical protein